MKKRVLVASTLLAAVFLTACESSSESTEADAVFEQALENANQAPAQFAGAPGAGGPPGMGGPPPGAGGPPGGPGGPPPEGPVSDLVPDLITTYKSLGDLELSAHMFYPEGHTIDDEVAVLTFMHGGALRRGSPAQGYELADLFTPMGVAVVAFEYRLLGTNADTLDEPVADAKSSIRWLRTNADALGIDPDRIVMSGHSAGAFLALTAGVVPTFDEESESAEVSSMPNALIPWSSMVTRSDDPEQSMLPEGMLMEDFSPASYVRLGLPPARFIHGDSDPVAPIEAALEFEERYRGAGNSSSFHIIEGADHFFRPPEHRQQVMTLIGEFLAELGYTEN